LISFVFSIHCFILITFKSATTLSNLTSKLLSSSFVFHPSKADCWVSEQIIFMVWGCQPHAQPPTWRTRVSLFIWVIALDLSGMGGLTGSIRYRQHRSRIHMTTQAPPLCQSRNIFEGSVGVVSQFEGPSQCVQTAAAAIASALQGVIKLNYTVFQFKCTSQ
jgi:hypothetical protein